MLVLLQNMYLLVDIFSAVVYTVYIILIQIVKGD
nr:MAG TPA: hypothetical protein [Bacteriophage sp.]